MESGQKTASYKGTQLLRGSGSALTAMGTWPASIRGEVRRALPLLNRLDPLHSAAVAAQWHQGTCLGIKSSTVLVVSTSVPAARRKRQRGDLVAVSSAGKQGGAPVGGQLRLGRHPARCSMPEVGRMSPALPVDRWKSPGLATAGACASLKVTASWFSGRS